MSIVKSFRLFEASIGSEAIRKKWYPKVNRKLFLQIINLDPTSVRKQDFSKPGKYSKWLLSKMTNKDTGDIEESGQYYLTEEKENLNYFLFVFSTAWFKSNKEVIKDINKFSSINDFLRYMFKWVESYSRTCEAKFDLIYDDDRIQILIPLNFTASWQTALNTDWCSRTLSGYKLWSYRAILFRIIPKSSNYQKVKLTWENGRFNKTCWTIASEKYPEITGCSKSPFDLIDGKESWLQEVEKRNDAPQYQKIRETMLLLSKEAKEEIEKYHEKFLITKK